LQILLRQFVLKEEVQSRITWSCHISSGHGDTKKRSQNWDHKLHGFEN